MTTARHLLESGLARINWIRAVNQFCVEQLICCQKCRAIACRAIAIQAVHPHSAVNIHNKGDRRCGGKCLIKYLFNEVMLKYQRIL